MAIKYLVYSNGGVSYCLKLVSGKARKIIVATPDIRKLRRQCRISLMGHRKQDSGTEAYGVVWKHMAKI